MDDELEFRTKSQSPEPAAPKFNSGRGDIEPGTVIAGRYKVIDKIGEGGMAVVYRIEQIFLREIMALKVLTTGLSDTSTVRFQKEAQVCRMLDHPNLIRVSDFALLENDSPYLVMEFINGESLADLLKRRGQLSESEAIDIFLQIMEGLNYAHEQRVIHRDLKPSNVMLFQRDDKQLQVKILDFGIAKITGKDTLNTMTLTNTGEIFGSPLFMSPEQCLGRTVDSRSDLYSIGCALYQVLTGAPPFAGESALSTMMMHLETEPLPLKQASLGKSFSPGIEKLTMKLLEKLPENRYQEASDVYDDLLAIKERRTPQERQAKTRQEPSKNAKVSPAVLSMIAVCIILAAGSIAILTFKNKNSQISAQSSDEPKIERIATGTSAPKPFFAATSIKDWKSGPWVFNFPNKEVGRIGFVQKDLNMDVAKAQSVPAMGIVALRMACPLYFSTYMVDFDTDDLFRFRPDEIQQLKLLDEKIYDQTIAKLVYFSDLQVLDLDNCTSLTNNCLSSIAKLPKLIALRLNTPYVDMSQLGLLLVNSRISNFVGKYLDKTDDFCRAIPSAKNLSSLRLEHCDLTNKGVFEIAKLPNLQNLEIVTARPVNNDCLGELSKLKSLRVLLMHETGVTADSIIEFQKFPSGCRLVILDTKKWGAVDRLKFEKAFPHQLVP